MDPQGAFGVHALLLSAVLVAGSFFSPSTTIVIALIVFALGALPALLYLVQAPLKAVPPWRRRRDRLVVFEWLVCAVTVPLAVGLIVRSTGAVISLSHHRSLAVVLIACLGGGVAGIVVSGLIDWYMILPRLAGIIGEPPCRSSGAQRWKWVTIGWYLHRSLAAIATVGGATGALIAITTFFLGHIDEFIVSEILTVMGLIAAGYKFRLPTAAMLILNPRVHVGDAVRYKPPVEGRASDGYVVDVSLEAVKIKDTKRRSRDEPRFFRKETTTVAINKVDDYIKRKDTPYRGCELAESGCAGINWYCKNNERGS